MMQTSHCGADDVDRAADEDTMDEDIADEDIADEDIADEDIEWRTLRRRSSSAGTVFRT